MESQLVSLIKMRKSVFVLLLAVLIGGEIDAQENNYLYSNYGPAAFIKGGVEIAGSRSTSAIYYNPGALAFIEGTFIEAQADVFGFDFLNMENGAGEGIPIEYINFDVVPSFFGFTKQSRNKRLTFGVSTMVKTNSRITFSADNVLQADLIQPSSDLETFEGTYNYRNNLRETWVLGALGYKINENIGLGLSTNIVVRIQDFDRAYNAAVYPTQQNTAANFFPDKLALFQRSEALQFRGTGLVFKLGANAEYGNAKYGITITAPNLNAPILRNRSSKQITSVLPDISDSTLYASTVLDFWRAEYRTPWIVELGGEFPISNKVDLSLMVNWYSKISPYDMLRSDAQSVAYGTVVPTHPSFARAKMANRSVLNAGAAVTVELRDNLYYGGSFRTDFNYFDKSRLEYFEDYVPYFTFWDIYHLTSGIAWTGERTSLSVGMNLGMGFSKNDPQLVNMTNPRQDNFLLGDINNNTSTSYFNASFVVSISYSVSTISGLNKN